MPTVFPTGDARTYLDVDMLEPEPLSIAGGRAAIVSVRKPENAGANQDAAAIIPARDDAAVLVVSDGCGGMASGEQAARIAVETLAAHVASAISDGVLLRTAILDGVEEAHRQVLALKTGAGATLALALIEGDEARPIHVGDSQILLVGGRGKVKFLTTSHSPVGYAVESGLLEDHEAIDHEERHLVSNYLGFEGMHVDVGSPRILAAHDALLIASDGVYDNLLVEELIALLRSGPVETMAAKIAGLAAERMATPKDGQPSKPDDLTLIVYSRRNPPPKRRSRAKKPAAT